jgi:uncharacterized protein with NAD-binding domain and iron-sulfur cluster
MTQRQTGDHDPHASTDGRTTRRRFLRDATATTAAAAGMAAAGPAAQALGARRSGRNVAIFGAGVAGLTAAHELAVRGYQVTVYERSTHLGGKAWSIDVPNSAAGGRLPLPGEHGFRFFPGFYKNLGDTMRRTPVGGGTAHDLLVRASTYLSARSGSPNATVPISLPAAYTPSSFVDTLAALFGELQTIPVEELVYFATRLLVYVTSCQDRRFKEWEYVSWTDFTYADQMQADYKQLLTRSLTRNLAAEQATDASANSIGWVGEASIFSILGLGNDQDATFDRVLDGPTSEVWLNPWVAYLQSLGVTFHTGQMCTALQVSRGRVAGATVTDAGGNSRNITADWYLSAMPVDRFVNLLSSQVLAADPGLATIHQLETDWMSGVQFYLTRPLPLTNGHVNYVDSPWALTSISQAQFWTQPFSETWGDGTVNDCLSTIISDWVTPGILYGRPAKQCSAQQIANEVWAQVKAHVNKPGNTVLTDSMQRSWFIDPAIIAPGTPNVVNDTPMFIQNTGSWPNRPTSQIGIPNLFLAGDWVQSPMMVTTMESANEGGRLAVNALLEAAHAPASPCTVEPLQAETAFPDFLATDQQRYDQGMRNEFDVPPPADGSIFTLVEELLG